MPKTLRKVAKPAIVQRSSGKRIKLGGYRRDPIDPSDRKYCASRYSAAQLPPKVDLRQHMTPVENQGELNSCTGNAMAGAYEYLAKRLQGKAEDVSRLFIYYNARYIDNSIDQDEGAYLRSCIQALKEYGACFESTWPYDPTTVFDEPDENSYSEGAYFLIDDAQRIEVDLYAMKHCLAEGYPIAFGLSLYDSFYKVDRRGRVPMPNPEREGELGGHAMLIVGYSDPDRMFVVRNSWGPDWGDKGYCYIPYNYVANPEYSHDCWTIRSVTDFDMSEDVWEDDESFFEDEEYEYDEEEDYDYDLEYEEYEYEEEDVEASDEEEEYEEEDVENYDYEEEEDVEDEYEYDEEEEYEEDEE